jgi:hypothetical protein
MKERKRLSAENILVGATAVVGTVVETVLRGHNPAVEIPLVAAVALVQGIPLTPMLTAVRLGLKEIVEG